MTKKVLIGKMDLPEQEVIDLLANGDVTIKILG